jgi:hypothetical protein
MVHCAQACKMMAYTLLEVTKGVDLLTRNHSLIDASWMNARAATRRHCLI